MNKKINYKFSNYWIVGVLIFSLLALYALSYYYFKYDKRPIYAYFLLSLTILLSLGLITGICRFHNDIIKINIKNDFFIISNLFALQSKKIFYNEITEILITIGEKKFTSFSQAASFIDSLNETLPINIKINNMLISSNAFVPNTQVKIINTFKSYLPLI